MDATITEFINYYSPALIQLGTAILLLALGFFLAILATYAVKWAFNFLKKDKYERYHHN